MKKPKSVDEYISGFPTTVQFRLKSIRKEIKRIVPEAEESISYGMPAFKYLGKPLVYFAGYDKHVGFYALPTGHATFKKELSGYKQGKGSVQFPNEEPLPMDLIKRIVAHRKKENESAQSSRKN